MSMRSLESVILRGAREKFKNSKLRVKDIQEWSTGDIKPSDDSEVTEHIPDPGVWVTIKKDCDKRK